MTLSLSKLQECAEKATRGPWECDDDGDIYSISCLVPDEVHPDHLSPKPIATSSTFTKENNESKFIASFNPETAKALIRVASAALESQAKFMSITDMAMPNGGGVFHLNFFLFR